MRGNRVLDGRFMNADNMQPVGFGSVLRWAFTANPQRAEKKADTFRLPVKNDPRIFTKKNDAFCWLGHAAFLFRLDGKLLLTDPCLDSSMGLKRLVTQPFPLENFREVDYVLITHTHRDHVDESSIRKLLRVKPELHFLAPLRTGKLLRSFGVKHITEAAWYQRFSNVPEPEIIFLPARHWSRRWMHDTNLDLWGSYYLRSKSSNIYFAGDTAYGAHFSELGKLFPQTKYAFFPIGAYKPEWMMKRAHTSPQEAVQGFHELGAQVFIPMHFATYDLSNEPISEPLRTIKELKQNGTLKGELLTPAVGETVFL